MPGMKTIHLIFNAHIDPIWLWPWTSGLDEALATCRSACERLERHPDLRFTQGEGWIFQQVEQCDPALFARIRGHIASGRWDISGSWWIQPDCNLPGAEGLAKQIALGRAYMQSRFGQASRIGYNVDSFGHAATLPGLMRAAGQDSYVMMRPQEHEMKLPARLFRWRGFDGGPEVTTFRIAGAYCTRGLWLDHLQRSLSELPDGIDHTMCFLGVGDHGGGPTEEQIAWVREHWERIPGARLEFSTPARYFAAIAAQIPALPLVTGELQHHAIGCFGVHRAVKTGVRRAEHRLHQAQQVVAGLAPAQQAAAAPRLAEAWEKTCFHMFHDTMGGTCIPSAYRQVDDQLGFAAAIADEACQTGMRQRMNAIPEAPVQRVVLLNASDTAAEGWFECEPWLEDHARGDLDLCDEHDRPIATQVMHSEALAWGPARLLFRARLEAGQMRPLRVHRRKPAAPPCGVETIGERLVSIAGGVAVDPAAHRIEAAGLALAPRLHLIEDATDTWSHGIDRFPEGPAEAAQWDAPALWERGPLMASAISHGRIGGSRLCAEWRVYAGEAMAELRLRVWWNERRKLLKLVLPLPAAASARRDGIPGASLARACDGRELPLRDWTLVELAGGQRLGVVCPDVFALDGSRERLRFTLLRGALLAHHEPHQPNAARMSWSDQGEHEFRFRFHLGSPEAADLEAQALAWQRPPLMADLTRGMPCRFPA